MSKEKHVIRYIVEWELDGKTPDTLFRYIDDGKGYWCEGLSLDDNGEWSKSNVGMGLLGDIGNGYYDQIPKEQAEEFAKQLGGSIHD